jgi:hypothetical protein
MLAGETGERSRAASSKGSLDNPETPPPGTAAFSDYLCPLLLYMNGTGSMSGFKNSDDFNERLSAAAKARQVSLEKFRARPRADDVAVAEQRAARLATSQARNARKAARAAETARLQEEVIRQAAEEVARKATAEAEKAAQEVTLEAERKAARDARYAARKARQR